MTTPMRPTMGSKACLTSSDEGASQRNVRLKTLLTTFIVACAGEKPSFFSQDTLE